MPDQQLKLVTSVRKDGNYYAMIAYDEPEKHLMQTGLNDGVDVNVGHFNSCGYRLNILPKRLDYLYKRTNHYQQMLGIKRFRNEDYKKTVQNYNLVEANPYDRTWGIGRGVTDDFSTYKGQNKQGKNLMNVARKLGLRPKIQKIMQASQK